MVHLRRQERQGSHHGGLLRGSSARQQVTRSTDGNIQVVGVNPFNKRPLMLMQILQMAPSAQPRISRQLALPPIAGSWCH
jgi:hypothetical protein